MKRVWRHRWFAPLALALVASLLVPATSVEAFKPYTHAAIAEEILDDIQDGRVTIGGREYPVDPSVVAAITNFPEYFNAGLIGPDGFPTFVMGQTVIHPNETGKWLQYLLDEAWWRAQPGGVEDPLDAGRNLAFVYGYLGHAAGDVWSHTIVNEFAGGSFPEAGDILTDVEKASNAFRHLVVEAYIADATAGFDNDPRASSLPDGDVSDDSTPGIPMNAPHLFIFQTMVRESATLPVGTCFDGIDDDGDGVADDGCPGNPFTVGDPEPDRGVAIDFFLDLKSDLQFAKATFDLDADYQDCIPSSLDADCKTITATRTINTSRGLRTASVVSSRCFAEYFCLNPPDTDDALDDVAMAAMSEYLDAWIDDIDAGLAAWSELGLGITRALFDPQTRRNLQNAECPAANYGTDTVGNAVRRECEDGIGLAMVLAHETEPFILDHLIPMLGAPDVTSDVLASLLLVSDVLGDLIDPLLNPIRPDIVAMKTELRERAELLIALFLEEKFDLALADVLLALEAPSTLISQTEVTLTDGTVIPLFAEGDHARLDRYLGLGDGHHGGPDGRLGPDDEFDPSGFAAYTNAVTLTKLALLDGPTLDLVLSDLVGVPYAYYQFFENANVMTVGLTDLEIGKPSGPPRLSPVVGQIDLNPEGSQPNGPSYMPDISDDGRYVVFFSEATDLVDGDTNEKQDVFWRDRVTGETRRVSVASDGTQGNDHSAQPAISGNGRYVVFASLATNLVSWGVAPYQPRHVYRHDTQTGITELVSTTASGEPATGNNIACTRFAVDSSGQHIVFSSNANNLFGSAWSQVVRKNMSTGTVELVSKNNFGQAGNSGSCQLDILFNGERVLYSTNAQNINGELSFQVWMWDADTDTSQLVSHSHLGSNVVSDGVSHAWFGDGGSSVFFSSTASDLVAGVSGSNTFRFDTLTGDITREVAGASGLSAVGGSVLAYNTSGQVSIWDSQAGAGAVVSLAPDGSLGDAISNNPRVAANGVVVFTSLADNLTDSPDPAAHFHVFVAEPPFFGGGGDDDPPPAAPQWLRSIDGDHAWRADSSPIFGPSPGPHAGTGQFPLWESCVLRDLAFRRLFVDWETPEHRPGNPVNFPAYFDDPSPDKADPDPPSATLEISNGYSVGTDVFVGPKSTIVARGIDGFWGDGHLTIRVDAEDTEGSGYATTLDSGDAVSFTSFADGRLDFSLIASDPCATQPTPSLVTVILDTTPPEVVTTGVPEAWTNAPVTISLAVSDAGSGIASLEYSLNGGTAVPFNSPHLLRVADEGQHVVEVTTTDNVGNTRVEQATFGIDTSPPSPTWLTPHRSRFTGVGTVTVSLEALAEDPSLADGADGSGVVKVIFEIFTAKGALSAEVEATPAEGAWVAELADLPKGRYEVVARATDAAGNSAESEPITIQVARPKRA